jgi:hypothetical protein
MAYDPTKGVDLKNDWPLAPQFDNLGSLISKLFPIALLVAGIIFFGLIIIAGFNLMSGAGNDDAHAKEKWRQVLTSGAIGLLIIFASYFILQVINFLTNGSLKGLLGG